MIERWIYSLSEILTLQMFFLLAVSLLAAIFLYWLIKYQFCLMLPQIKIIKRLCRFVSEYKGIKMELVPLLGRQMQGKVNQAVWQEYEAAMLARRPAAVRSYFTYSRIYDIPCRRESALCYKWYALVLGLALGVFGWVLIKVGQRLSLLEAVYSENFIYIMLLLMVTLLLVLLYSVIESGIYSSALKALESFCSLCDRALPAARKDFLNELRPGIFKKTVQTVSYMPHFISTVVLVGIVQSFLSPYEGIVNTMITSLGGQSINFVSEPVWFRTIYIGSGLGQNFA